MPPLSLRIRFAGRLFSGASSSRGSQCSCSSVATQSFFTPRLTSASGSRGTSRSATLARILRFTCIANVGPSSFSANPDLKRDMAMAGVGARGRGATPDTTVVMRRLGTSTTASCTRVAAMSSVH